MPMSMNFPTVVFDLTHMETVRQVEPVFETIARASDDTVFTDDEIDRREVQECHIWLDRGSFDNEKTDAMLRRIVSKKVLRHAVLDLRENCAESMLNSLQKWLDEHRCDDPHRRKVLYLLIKLTAASDRFPRAPFITQVKKDSDDPWRVGGPADIFKGRWIDKDDLEYEVVMKTPRIMPENRDIVNKRFINEALVWWQLKHDHIFPLLGIFGRPPERIYAISEYMPFRTLWHYTSRKPISGYDVPEIDRYDPEGERGRLLYEIACGLSYLHSQKIVHADLKPDNIFIDKAKRACIADFGSGSIGDLTSGRISTPTSMFLTARFSPPEHLKLYLEDPSPNVSSMKQPRPKRSFDMYSFGCIGYTVCTGLQYIFTEYGDVNFIQKVCDNARPDFPRRDHCNGPEPSMGLWYMFITRCWQSKPEDRPDVTTIRRILEREASHRHGKAYIFKVKTYRSREAKHEAELPYSKDEVLDVIQIPPNAEWWTARNAEGRTGDIRRDDVTSGVMFRAYAKCDFERKPKAPVSQISYHKDDVVEVVMINHHSGFVIWHVIHSGNHHNHGAVLASNFSLERKDDGYVPQSFKTLYSFKAPDRFTRSHGMSFERGEILETIQAPNLDSEWMTARRCGGPVQIIHTSFVQLIGGAIS